MAEILTANNIAARATQTLFGFQARDEFREAMEMVADDLRRERRIIQAARVRRVLRRDDFFEAVYQASVTYGVTMYAQSQAFGDGDFMKFFLDWLENGGWELILKIIKDLIGLM